MLTDQVNNPFAASDLSKDESKHGVGFYRWLKISMFIVFYIGIMLIQAHSKQRVILSGILSQFQVMISIYLAVRFLRQGYFTALCLNIIELVVILLAVFLNGVTIAITGIIVTFFTIISTSIIAVLVNRNARQFSRVIAQKGEITALYEEIAASEEELRQQNDQLMEYNQVIRKNEEKLNYLACFDTLTELANGKMIMDRLELLVQLSQKNPSARAQTFAVVFIDLDHFKKINDTLGHHIGDLLILSVSSRLTAVINENDMLGRLGGDQFALIIQQELNETEILRYVESLRNKLKESFTIERSEFNISASFGIAMYPQDADNPDELIRCADTAMYTAKNSGKNNIHFFRKPMLDEVLQKIELENRLIAAVKNEEFFLVFQPEYDVYSGDVRGFEALVRWRSPDRGVVSPLQFIPLAEEMGIIVPLGEWILRTACVKFREILDRYHIEAIVAVNISAVQLEDPLFVAMVKNVLADCGLAAKYLELEITESVCIKSIEQTILIMNELKSLGIQITLDDFGTGYSSLGYLQRLPINSLKIDKSFIDNLNEMIEQRNIVGPIISLVHHLGIAVIAEGVENEMQLNYLKKQNCDFVQGFLLGKPLSENELDQLLDGYKNSNRMSTRSQA